MKKQFLLFLLLLLTWSVTEAQEDPLRRIDDYFRTSLPAWGTPGVSVAVVRDGQIIFSKGYGTLEVGTSVVPDGNTLYAIASNTKAFTATMMAMLVEEGKADWDDKVKDYLPWFELYDPWVSREMTLRDLLCHRSGLGTFSGDFIWYKSDLTSEEIIRRVKFLPARFGFRDGYGYSNLMYITAGKVIEKITGKSWGDNLRERILNPLGMDRSVISLDQLPVKGNFATPHALVSGKNIPIPYTDWEEVAALGGIIASVDDIGRWMIFNMNKGIRGNDTLVTPASYNQLWKLHTPFPVDHTRNNDFNTHFRGYGLGWGLSDYRGRMMVNHSGAFDGMISAVTMIPEEKIGIVVLTNGLKTPVSAFTQYALDALLGLPERDWSQEYLKRQEAAEKRDTRIADRIATRVLNTKPSLPLGKYAGNYHTDIYGMIKVSIANNTEEKLRLDFEHSPALSATLEHWHFDVWKIIWDEPHAWFSFGTVKFNMTNNLEITGIDFDVPNDDIFFEELKPVRVK